MRTLIFWLSIVVITWGQNVGIGTANPHPTARLEIADSTRGFLIPRLTTQQRDGIANPAHALIIFNVDSFCLEVYDTVTQKWYIISCPKGCITPSCLVTISGPTLACTGDTIVYTASGCSGVFYQWNVPTGWTIVSGQGSDTLRAVPDTTDGDVVVTPCDQCGCGTSTSLSVTADTCNFSNTFCLVIGGSNDDRGYAVVQSSDLGYVIAGYTASFGQGSNDVYVVKIDGSGALQWTKTIGGANNDYSYSIANTTDGGFIIAGNTSSFGQGGDDVYIIKLDGSGNLQWTKAIGGTNNDLGYSVIQTSDGGFAIAGYSSSFGQGGNDLYVLKLDGLGNLLWSRTIGGVNDDFGYAIIETSDGGLAIAGQTQSFGQGNVDVYVVKLDGSGNLQWSRTIGGVNNDEGSSIIETSDNGFLIVGQTQSFGQGGWDVYAIKLDASGTLQWTTTVGGANDDMGYAVIQTTSGDYVIVGKTSSFGQGGWDVYIIKLDQTGALQWTRSVGGANDDRGFSVYETSDQGLIIVGKSQSFGQGGYDVYVVKIDGNGNLVSCPSGCQTSSGGIASTGGVTSAGGQVASGGTTATGGTISTGGILTNLCP